MSRLFRERRRQQQREKKKKPLSEQGFNLAAQERRELLKRDKRTEVDCIDVPYKGGALSRRMLRAGSSAACTKSSNSLEPESHTLN